MLLGARGFKAMVGRERKQGGSASRELAMVFTSLLSQRRRLFQLRFAPRELHRL
jgi:hypothetical protein